MLLLTVLTAGCSGNQAGVGDTPTATGDPSTSLELELAMQLLSQSWMAQSAADPSKVSEMIDAPGGEGWLRLFHGDLDGAEELFVAAQPRVEPSTKGPARLGLSRVHLARSRSLLATASLQSQAARALVRYRMEHSKQVRHGSLDAVLSRLILQGGAEEAKAGSGDSTEPGVVALEALLSARQATRGGAEGPALPEGLPRLYKKRLLFARAIAAGDVKAAEALLPDLQPGSPDITDSLGEDAEAGVSFEMLYFDPALPLALARHHLAQAWMLGAGLDGPGEAIAFAVQSSWGGPVPEGVRRRALPSAGPQPGWQALFLGPAIDRNDWEVYWTGEDSGQSFVSVLQDHMPGVPWLAGSSAADIDLILRAANGLEITLRDALMQSVGSEGASLSQDLGFDATTIDRLLRTRMLALLSQGAALQAKRLGERSLDVEPTRLGGAEESALTRVSYRNDRAFLLDLAHCLWKAGQVDMALSYVHPLSQEDPTLRGLAYYLGQLDAARSIRVQGKTSQL